MRKEIRPTPPEVRTFESLVKLEGDVAYARRDLPPMTCVAVCPGRVFSADDHARLFGSDDRFAQWTMHTAGNGAAGNRRPRHGYVITTGLPGGAFDPKYQDIRTYGLAPFFAEFWPTPKNVGRVAPCITVMRNDRTEYWTGRTHVRAGQQLVVSHKFQRPNMQEFWVMVPDCPLPVSIRWIARHNPTTLDWQHSGYDVRSPEHRQLFAYHARSRHNLLAVASHQRLRGPPMTIGAPPLEPVRVACTLARRDPTRWGAQWLDIMNALVFGRARVTYYSVIRPRGSRDDEYFTDLKDLLALTLALANNGHLYAMDAVRDVCSLHGYTVPRIMEKYEDSLEFRNPDHNIVMLTPWAAENVPTQAVVDTLVAFLLKAVCRAASQPPSSQN